MPETTLNEEMELFINQLKELNKKFSDSINDNKKFEESKLIWLRIKEANKKLNDYLHNESSFDELVEKR